METTNNNNTSDRELVITRLIRAPRERVFQAWTDPEQLKQWYAPNGCTIHFAQIDVRPGGRIHSCIHNPEYGDCWCVGTYLDIVAPERIVHTLSNAYEDGREASPADLGMDPGWPQETVITITFEEQDGGTKITLHQTVSEALAKHTGAHPSWLQMLDRLETLL